jgi:hypothetical protein
VDLQALVELNVTWGDSFDMITDLTVFETVILIAGIPIVVEVKLDVDLELLAEFESVGSMRMGGQLNYTFDKLVAYDYGNFTNYPIISSLDIVRKHGPVSTLQGTLDLQAKLPVRVVFAVEYVGR